MWLIEALKRDYELTVVTTGGWNLAELNSFYGTEVREEEVKVRIAPVPWIIRGYTAAAMRGSCFQRFARNIADQYDVRISAYNLTDWGLPAIHFIADFSWHDSLRERLDPPMPGFLYRDTPLRRTYLSIAKAFARPSGRNLLESDRLIANSYWTARVIQHECGEQCSQVVYPSVWMNFPAILWPDKEDAFAMIGRIAPEKQIERAISILDLVRRRGHKVRLRLCGKLETDAYGRRIAHLCKEHADWITLEGRVSGECKAKILASCRYGIQARESEPFGISVAEMIKAGAIVFAANDGGQTEILDHPDLLFTSSDDAADKISAVLADRNAQTALLSHLAAQSRIFTAERFKEEARALIYPHTSAVNFLPRRRKRLRIVIGHPRMGHGGSEAAVMWLIEGLKQSHDVTVTTTGGWDLAALNSYYGTQVQGDEVRVRIAPVPWFVGSLSVAALRGACFQRFARRIAAEYDVRISAYHPTDWGLPAIHFIADFSWHSDIRKRFDSPGPGFIYRDSWLRKAYLKLAAVYGRPSERNILLDDRLVANSYWAAQLLRTVCRVKDSEVVYPPVWTRFPEVAWADKQNVFVMIGRIAPEKYIERAITILEGVRQRGHRVCLHLCGQIGDDLYARRIARLCRERSEWIRVEGRVSGTKKAEVLSRCRFGIQTRTAEPFGISVAEMVKAGAIVFAADNGGQTEIIANRKLLFSNMLDAVDKIHTVLQDVTLQSDLRAHLARQSELFSADRFMREAGSVIAASSTVLSPPNSPLDL